MPTPGREDVKVVLSAEDRFSTTFASFRRQLDGGNTLLTGMAGRVGALGLSLGTLGAGLTFTGALAGIKAAANGLDALNDSADAVGDTVENLSALEDVARRNGGNLDLVTSAVLKMNQALREGDPKSPVSRALSAIGLSSTALRKENPTEALRQIAVALNGVENDGTKARIAQTLFGKSLAEIAPFLKDVAEAGKLTATITEEQTNAAKRFNEALSVMQTEASNAGRSIVSNLLPAMTQIFEGFNKDGLRGAFDGLGEVMGIGRVYQEGRFLKALANDLKDLQEQNELVTFGPFKKGLEEQIATKTKEYENARRLYLRLTDVRGGRGSVNPEPVKPKLLDFTDTAPAAKAVNEAQRYLEALQKQGEKLEDLTVLEQVLRDVQAGRIKGLTPALEKQIVSQAKFNDLVKESTQEREAAGVVARFNAAAEAKAQDAAIKKQEDFNRLIEDALARDTGRTQSLLDDTAGGRFERAQADIARLREALNDPAGDKSADFANRVLEAIEKIKAGLAEVPEAGKTAFDRLADHIDKAMDGSTDAVLDFLSGIDTDPKDIWKAFKRDILRSLVEDPVRAAMDQVKKAIRDAVTAQASGEGDNSLFGSALKFLGSVLTGSRANGGRVVPGGEYRINENGRETFLPDQPGTILGAGASRARAAGGPVYNDNRVIQLNGPVPAEQVAMFKALLAEDRARMQRSMRYGRLSTG